MADPLQVIVRMLHIGAGVVFVGGATLWGLVLMPALAQLGPTLPKGAFPTLIGRVMKVLPHAALLTLLMGVVNLYLLGGFAPGRMSEPWGVLMGLSMVLMLGVVGIAYGVLTPTGKRLIQLMQAGPPGPEMAALAKRLKTVSMANIGLAWLIVLLMVLAVSLRST